ncbi:sensor histidine kinase [Shewanella sp. A3A]|uniref:histidine kinase n=1 Tax=Shewanella electrica TaxID=515560 RepID=A0ABT2FQV3_9GAMM|nr:sensor histidine kinase [Shewanella electrica]MCH1921404.1 sensor histidine kinase [Shewanella ferrihydritica]MCH1927022.1 sensor histidine kinase [Shewanella electrica]MCS4558623.1 sensor histidine kinase [Shewanella electrica]
MRIALKPKKRLLTRMFLTSLSIIALVGFGLAWMVNILHAQNSYNEETAKLIAEIPQVAAELREHDLIPDTSAWLEENNTKQSYVMASCDDRFNQVWTSALAVDRGLFDICERFNSIRDEIPPYFLSMNDQRGYFAYLLSVDIASIHYNLLVLKDAEKIQQESSKFAKRTYLRLALVLALALLLLVSAAYWGMQPLGRMRNELKAIIQGRNQSLSKGYPVELEGITQALNELIRQSGEQQQRYQNAMNDLAHSLKTRLAAVHAITDDQNLNRKEMAEKVMEQVSQMDHLVKYQLKRAMLGRKGLKKETTMIAPLINQLSQMLFKVYRDKNVAFSANISEDLAFPGEQGDLMELVGNLMENAFRLCISTVLVTATRYKDILEIIVEDDGPGVEESLRQKITQRGVRADTRSSGQGIGLAVCQEIVDSYDGTLTIEQSELEGALFRITIPLA